MSVQFERDRTSHLPRYRQIADVLANDIRYGKYPVGEFLPTENKLAEKFETSRQTVRESLRVLDQKGLILRKAGSGTLVIDRGERSFLNLAVGNLGELLSYPQGVKLRHLECSQFVTDDLSAEILGCAPGKLWIRLRCLRFDAPNDVPLCWADIYVLPEYASVFKNSDVGEKTFVEKIEKHFGVRVDSAEVDVTVARIKDYMAKELQAEEGSPALKIVRRYLNSANEPFEVTINTHPEGRYAYQIMLR